MKTSHVHAQSLLSPFARAAAQGTAAQTLSLLLQQVQQHGNKGTANQAFAALTSIAAADKDTAGRIQARKALRAIHAAITAAGFPAEFAEKTFALAILSPAKGEHATTHAINAFLAAIAPRKVERKQVDKVAQALKVIAAAADERDGDSLSALVVALAQIERAARKRMPKG